MTRKRLSDPGKPQSTPHHRGCARDYRLAERRFEHLQYRQCWHTSAAKEHGLGVLSVDHARQGVSSFGCFVVNVRDPLHIGKADDLEAMGC
jgi:hypothetical protein